MQIWEMASGGHAQLNPIQFNTSMRLVALAQVRRSQRPRLLLGDAALAGAEQCCSV